MIRALAASLRPLRFWIGLAAVQVLVGWFLYCFLPPEPRWSLPSGIVDHQALEHGRLITAAWNAKNEPAALRDPYSGEILQSYFADLRPHHLIHPDGDAVSDVIACVENSTLHVASIANGKTVATCPLGEGSLNTVSLSPDARFATVNRQMSADAKDIRCSVIEIATQKKVFELEGRGTTYFSPQGDMIAVNLRREFDNDPQQIVVKVWSVQTEECVLELPNSDITRGLWPPNGFDANGRTLSIGVGDSWQVWDVVQRKCILKEPTLCNRVQRACTSDGRFLVFACLRNNASTVKVWDRDSESVVIDKTFDDPVVVAISPDNTWLAVQSGALFGSVDLSLYEIKTGLCLWSTGRTPLGLFEAPPPVFTADCQRVFVYRSDKAHLQAHYLDVRSGQLSLAVPTVASDRPHSVHVYLTASPKIDLIVALLKRSSGPDWLDKLYKYMGIQESDHYVCCLVDKEGKATQQLFGPLVDPSSFHVWSEKRLFVGQPGNLERSVYLAYDFNRHGPWRWVLGVPAVLGVLVAACWWRYRRGGLDASE